MRRPGRISHIIIQSMRTRGINALTAIFLISLFSMAGCDSGNNDNENFCYIESSSNPCFDPNEGGSTAFVTDQTVEEVIPEQEGMEGFEDQLPVTNILEGVSVFGIPGPGCPFEESELVIKTNNDWNRFRNSCFFSLFELPNVDFSSSMVLVSTQNFAEYGTRFEALLEFDDHLTAVIQDDISEIAPPSPGFPFNIISIPKRDLPVDFIRVENDIIP